MNYYFFKLFFEVFLLKKKINFYEKDYEETWSNQAHLYMKFFPKNFLFVKKKVH
jgi:hypothetical protein